MGPSCPLCFEQPTPSSLFITPASLNLSAHNIPISLCLQSPMFLYTPPLLLIYSSFSGSCTYSRLNTKPGSTLMENTVYWFLSAHNISLNTRFCNSIHLFMWTKFPRKKLEVSAETDWLDHRAVERRECYGSERSLPYCQLVSSLGKDIRYPLLHRN